MKNFTIRQRFMNLSLNILLIILIFPVGSNNFIELFLQQQIIMESAKTAG